MTYRINKTDGNQLTDIPDGTFDTDSTSLTLIGKNVTSFGEAVNENFVKLLENFASSSAPESALKGQLWYDTASGRLNVYDGTDFRAAGGPIVSAREPGNLVAGDLWINNETNQLWFYDGTDLVLAGPVYNSLQGTTGFVVETVLDIFNRGKTVAKLYVGSVLLGIFSKETFTPAQPIVGYSTEIKEVKVGFNVGSLPDTKFDVIVTRAENILTTTGDLKSAEQIVYNDEDQVIVGALTLQSDSGLTIGGSEDVDLKVNVNGKFIIEHKLSNQDIGIQVKSPTGTVEAITLDATNTRVGIFQQTPEATLDVNGNLKVAGDLIVGGETVTLSVTVLEVEDKNITLGNTLSVPTDTGANGGGITLKGTTDKTILFDSATSSWNSNIHWNLDSGNNYKINNVTVLTNDTLGAGIINSSLTSVGTLVDLTVDNINIDGNTIGSLSGNVIINPSSNVSISSKRIVSLADPVDEQDAATKSYTDARVFDRGISMSMDITGLDVGLAPGESVNEVIAEILDRIAPFYDPTTAPEGTARAGTRLRLHTTIMSATTGDITYTPTLGTEFTTTLVDKNGTENQAVVSDIANVQTITGPSVSISVVRQDKLFVMGGGLTPTPGKWGFESDINAPY